MRRSRTSAPCPRAELSPSHTERFRFSVRFCETDSASLSKQGGRIWPPPSISYGRALRLSELHALQRLGLETSRFTRAGGRGGLQPDMAGAFLKLSLPVELAGPIALGKHAHFGLGLFRRA